MLSKRDFTETNPLDVLYQLRDSALKKTTRAYPLLMFACLFTYLSRHVFPKRHETALQCDMYDQLDLRLASNLQVI